MELSELPFEFPRDLELFFYYYTVFVYARNLLAFALDRIHNIIFYV